MSRLLIAAVVIAVVITVYAVIDCAMTDAKRTRALSKPVWILVTLVVPLVGPVLWILFGKGLLLKPVDSIPSSPDDDSAFLTSLNEDSVHDDRIRQLEEELRALDEELETGTFPGQTEAEQSKHGDADDDADTGRTRRGGESTGGETAGGEATAGIDHRTRDSGDGTDDDDERPGGRSRD